MKKNILIFLTLVFSTIPTFVQGQKTSLSVGTDIPYQFYLGATLETPTIDISYRTGILVPPYSNIILNTLEAFGTKDIYIKMLDDSYNFGWMNSIGMYYKLGKQRSWYFGPEFRLDYLTASDTPFDLIEAVTGYNMFMLPWTSNRINAELGLTMYAVGLRLGHSIVLDKNNHHILRTEFSLSKHIATQSSLFINNQSADNINQKLDKKLWEDVFKTYGFVGGIGLSYSYRF